MGEYKKLKCVFCGYELASKAKKPRCSSCGSRRLEEISEFSDAKPWKKETTPEQKQPEAKPQPTPKPEEKKGFLDDIFDDDDDDDDDDEDDDEW